MFILTGIAYLAKVRSVILAITCEHMQTTFDDVKKFLRFSLYNTRIVVELPI